MHGVMLSGIITGQTRSSAAIKGGLGLLSPCARFDGVPSQSSPFGSVMTAWPVQRDWAPPIKRPF